MTNPTNQIPALWDRLATKTLGPRLFSRLLGRLVPYTGSIRPDVLELRAGYARVQMRDRRGVRNHLNSIHAIALANLGEVTSGLALIYGLPEHARAILTGFSIEYLKKARGTLTAEATTTIPSGLEREDLEILTSIRDLSGEEVARSTARWLVGPREAKS
jgi:acyl-coenzyme A thioesterase PaaI-like protein